MDMASALQGDEKNGEYIAYVGGWRSLAVGSNGSRWTVGESGALVGVGVGDRLLHKLGISTTIERRPKLDIGLTSRVGWAGPRAAGGPTAAGRVIWLATGWLKACCIIVIGIRNAGCALKYGIYSRRVPPGLGEELPRHGEQDP
jgi:hypothetical protein